VRRAVRQIVVGEMRDRRTLERVFARWKDRTVQSIVQSEMEVDRLRRFGEVAGEIGVGPSWVGEEMDEGSGEQDELDLSSLSLGGGAGLFLLGPDVAKADQSMAEKLQKVRLPSFSSNRVFLADPSISCVGRSGSTTDLVHWDISQHRRRTSRLGLLATTTPNSTLLERRSLYTGRFVPVRVLALVQICLGRLDITGVDRYSLCGYRGADGGRGSDAFSRGEFIFGFSGSQQGVDRSLLLDLGQYWIDRI
jgi:hypothetical protein